jgi:uncharacterized protein YndB with AHSA1/START domain
VIQRRVVVPAEADRLWRALTDPDEAGTWLGGRLEWVPEPGQALRFTPADPSPGSGAVSWDGRVESVVPGRYLRFRWWSEDSGPDSASEVSYVLEPVESAPATILTVEEVPAGAATGALCYARVGESWTHFDDLELHLWAAGQLARPLGL